MGVGGCVAFGRRQSICMKLPRFISICERAYGEQSTCFPLISPLRDIIAGCMGNGVVGIRSPSRGSWISGETPTPARAWVNTISKPRTPTESHYTRAGCGARAHTHIHLHVCRMRSRWRRRTSHTPLC